MSYADKAIGGMSEQATSNMHTSFPALVVSYDEDAHTATIQPMFKYDSSTNYPQIQGVPVARWRYKIMQNKHVTESGSPHSHQVPYSWTSSGGSSTATADPESSHTHPIEFEEIIEEINLLLYPGDVVLCVVVEKSIDSISSKQVHDPMSKRKFDISDAVITSILY